MTEPSPAEALTLGTAAAAIVTYAKASPKQRKEILATCETIIEGIGELADLAKKIEAAK